ncbi:MAG: hypothetical protein E7365_06115 [Clostridiales bacterium]|nr:hypothetical protein [Clostridiales bacterium]
MCILDYIPYGQNNAVTGTRLSELTGINRRKIRKIIAEERRKTPILNLQDGKGYFKPTEEEKHLVERYVKQETARLKSVGWSLKAAREFVKQ